MSVYSNNQNTRPLTPRIILLTIYILVFINPVCGDSAIMYRIEAFKDYLLHQSYTACHEVDTVKEQLPCSINSHEEHKRLLDLSDSLQRDSGYHVPSCLDASVNMTCLPLSISPDTYSCACNSAKRVLNTAIKWSDEWEEASEPVTAIKRTLCNTESGWCLDGMFKRGLGYLMQRYAPLDTQIEVSSKYTNTYSITKVRLHYVDYACAFTLSDDDLAMWVQIDLIQAYVATGLLLRKRCDFVHGQQYVITFHVSSSMDGASWDYIDRDVQAVYQNISFTWWFGGGVTGRFWKLEPITYRKHASLQMDLIGYIV